MRMLGLLALVSAAAVAQELPPVGTYYKLERVQAWPDPSKLTTSQRMDYEILLRQAHAARQQELANERYRNMTPEEKRAEDDKLRRALAEIKPPR